VQASVCSGLAILPTCGLADLLAQVIPTGAPLTPNAKHLEISNGDG
jgi:hypothetical protein